LAEGGVFDFVAPFWPFFGGGHVGHAAIGVAAHKGGGEGGSLFHDHADFAEGFDVAADESEIAEGEKVGADASAGFAAAIVGHAELDVSTAGHVDGLSDGGFVVLFASRFEFGFPMFEFFGGSFSFGQTFTEGDEDFFFEDAQGQGGNGGKFGIIAAEGSAGG